MGQEQHAPCTRFLLRLARKELNIQRVAKSLLSQYILCLGWCRRHIWAHNERMCWQIDSWSCFGCTIFVSWDISHSVLAKKKQALFAIKVELGDPLIFHSKVPEFHGFFGSCYRNILTCFSKVTLKCMIFALELRVLNVRLGPYSAICTVRKHSFGRQSQSSLPSGRQP